jgi:beta-mannosidase
MNVHVTNDTLARWDGGLQWSLETLAGEPLASGENSVSARPLQDTLVCSLDFTDRITPEDKREFVFVCELRKDGHLQALQVVALCPNKHINLVDPGLTTALSLDGDRLAVALSVGSLARFVELSIDGVDAVFSDNYFDVPAGRIVTVSCPLPPGKTLDDIRHSLHIRSLYDSYVVQ